MAGETVIGTIVQQSGAEGWVLRTVMWQGAGGAMVLLSMMEKMAMAL